MAHGRRTVSLELLLGISLTGCGPDSPAPFQAAPSGSVVIDLSALRRPPGATPQQTCVSLAAGVVLRVEDGSQTQEFRQTTPATSGVVRFDGIEVDQGTVRFSAEVLSENQSLLYGGDHTQRIEEPTFEAALELEPQGPVLQVCPGDISLLRAGDFSASVQVHNRGIGTLTYEALSPDCDAGPCVEFGAATGSVAAGSAGDLATRLVHILPATSLELTIQSPQGSVPVNVALDRLPDLVIRSLELTDPITVNEQLNFEQPVRVVIRNNGNAAADIFKIAAEYTAELGTFFTPFQVPGQGDPSYGFSESVLQPGDEVALGGVVVFSSAFLNGANVRFRLEADSCSGDEFQEPFCRVDEFDEGNNFSGDIELSLPILIF